MHVNFRINSYTKDEWPSQELLDLESFSVGQEQSLGSVVALSWSTIGLAKHKRSALAVLTTNHVLSLWASASDPKVASTWKRVLVVNKALEVYYQPVPSYEDYEPPARNRSRSLCRVRSMSWALVEDTDRSIVENSRYNSPSRSSTPIQYLAVTNDADETAILLITSPWVDHRSSIWKAQVVTNATWDYLESLFTSNQGESGMELDDSAIAGAGRDQWPSVFATAVSEEAVIDSVMYIPCQSSSASLGLILRKNRRFLRLEVLLGTVYGSSTCFKWMPLSSFGNASSSNIYFPSFDGGCATFLEKVFSISSDP